MRKRPDNRGSSMIIIIVVIAFVSILIATLLTLSVINIQMKSVDREAKENFYSAEGALEQITLGLQKELSEVSSDAYAVVMQQYVGNTLEIQRRQIFNQKLLGDLKGRLENGKVLNQYDVGVLVAYLTADVAANTVVDSIDATTYPLVLEEDSLVLKNLKITYTDTRGYQSIIETDIRLSAPNLNLIQPSDMPDVFEYSIIANKELVSEAGGTVNIGAGVYAGEDGLTLTSGSVWQFKQANRVVVNGDVNIPNTASLSTTEDMDVWAKEMNVMGGTLVSRGRTYVSNDLILSNQGSNVTLEGEYYGFGNGELLTDAGLMLSAGGDSSAILINGTDSTLDMSNMRRLLLSGSAQIATGKVTYDETEIEGLLPEKDPGLSEQIRLTDVSSGTYYLKSIGNGLLVCSAEAYLCARTQEDYTVTSGSWELLSIIYNEDGTISLMDQHYHNNKYVSVQTENQDILLPTATEVGINEKFRIYVIKEGNTNYHALQSCATGKFISIDSYYPAGETTPVEGVLRANRDKVTDKAQLFYITHFGSLPMVEEEELEPEPVVAFTYDNAGQISVEFGDPNWDGSATDYNNKVRLTYEVKRGGTTVSNGYELDMNTSSASGKLRRFYYNIRDLQINDVIEYTIEYTNGGNANDVGYLSGSYTHRTGYGNAPNTTDTLGVVDGIYFIRNIGADSYIQKDGTVFKGAHSSATESDGSWEEFVVVNNHDGTVSFKSVVAMDYYLSVQEDGTLQTLSTSIGDNEKFKLEAVGGGADVYRLQTLPESRGQGKYLYCNLDQVFSTDLGNKWICVLDKATVAAENDDLGYFSLNWLRVTGEIGTREVPVAPPTPPNYNPVTSMVYSSESSAKASFTSLYWEEGPVGTVKMFYKVGDVSDYIEVLMTMTGANASWTISGPALVDGAKVSYYFIYDYVDQEGVRQTRTTTSYIYIHETRYGDAVQVDGENDNVDLGESIEVKSNQIAYLVPPECIGVNGEEVFGGKNPMSAAEFTQMMSYANNTTKYPDYEVVSFTKKLEGLDKSLGAYRTEGTDGYETIFVQTSDGTMVYFYVDFDADNTAAYFRDYYAAHQSELESYMKNYVNKIKLSDRFTRLTTNGNMVYSADGGGGSLDLRSNEGFGAYLSEVELSGLRNEEAGYQKRFKALSKKLMLDYDELTQVEKVRTLFDNIVRYSEDPADADTAFAGWGVPSVTPITYEVDGVKALVVHNSGVGAYHYNSDGDNEVCLIVATGDVVLEQNFSGVVIARGKVTVAAGVNRITGNQEDLYKVLKCKINPSDENSKTLIEHYFRDGERYILDESSDAIVTDADYISYADLVTYEEWTKK